MGKEREIDMARVHRCAVAKDFRDYADRDYIAARTLFRNDCKDGFLSFSHRCIEQYLKSIILYRAIPFKRGTHDLIDLLEVCENMMGHFPIDEESRDFVKQISHYNDIRYPTSPLHGKNEWLISLDKLVWRIRMFAQSDDDYVQRLFNANKEKLLKESFHTRKKVIFHGELEKIVRDKRGKFQKMRSNLVWKNFYFGTRKKQKILFRGGFWVRNNHMHYSDQRHARIVYDAVKDHLYFPKGQRF